MGEKRDAALPGGCGQPMDAVGAFKATGVLGWQGTAGPNRPLETWATRATGDNNPWAPHGVGGPLRLGWESTSAAGRGNAPPGPTACTMLPPTLPIPAAAAASCPKDGIFRRDGGGLCCAAPAAAGATLGGVAPGVGTAETVPPPRGRRGEAILDTGVVAVGARAEVPPPPGVLPGASTAAGVTERGTPPSRLVQRGAGDRASLRLAGNGEGRAPNDATDSSPPVRAGTGSRNDKFACELELWGPTKGGGNASSRTASPGCCRLPLFTVCCSLASAAPGKPGVDVPVAVNFFNHACFRSAGQRTRFAGSR